MLHKLFEKTVTIQTNKTALSYQDQYLSYNELNEKANQLANYLIDNGVARETTVVVLMERSLDMVVAILAILKAGGVYVPINPKYPISMIEYMIKDCSPKLLITNTNDKFQAEFYNEIKTVRVDDSKGFSTKNPDVSLPDNALAYIIYTSGSTGNPKGVMVEHRNVISLLDVLKSEVTSSDIWTLFHSISFDFSVWELFGCLTTGGELVIVPDNIRINFRKYRCLLIEKKVTILNQTPSAFYSLQLEELKYSQKKLSLTHIIFGGEKLNPIYLRKWKRKYNETKLINMYGITETTVHVTYKELTEKDIDSGISDIGIALPHLKIYLLDEHFQTVSGNEIGEIFVEGAGLARGYVNKPQITKEKFIYCSDISPNRLYRSGDLGRYLSNGNIEYIGRIDNQVKIRGHRIELEAIESYLNKYKGINQSVVIAFNVNETDKILRAYFTSDIQIEAKDLSNYLLTMLPTYMIPSVFIRVEAFFLNVNGKIDRNKLSECIEIKLNDENPIKKR